MLQCLSLMPTVPYNIHQCTAKVDNNAYWQIADSNSSLQCLSLFNSIYRSALFAVTGQYSRLGQMQPVRDQYVSKELKMAVLLPLLVSH